MPDLFVGNRSAKLYGFDLKDIYSDFNFEKIIEKKDVEPEVDRYSPLLGLYLHNIGFGAAKYVKGKWDYDYRKLIILISNVIKEDEFVFKSMKNGGVNEFNIKHISSGHFSSGSDFLNLEFEKDIVLPYNSVDESPKLYLPQIFIDLLSYYISFKYEMFDVNSKKDFIFDELVEIPQLKLRLEYTDIANKKYTKSMIFNFSISGKYDETYRRMDFGNIQLGTYHIEIKEIMK